MDSGWKWRAINLLSTPTASTAMLAIAIVFSRGFAQVAGPTKELVVTEVILPSQVERGLPGDVYCARHIRHRQSKCTRPSQFETAVQVRTLRPNTAYRPEPDSLPSVYTTLLDAGRQLPHGEEM